ncbi:acetyl-CoA carboxylase biotin carboxylase subunit [Parvularcula marina]|uniref:Acetyl/propionyl/methylcrotonyl-CoA carboxylase subunit alpha n=1 Tax=Parvularcula marina TaxID=2292771 RepID=A0A371RGC3_9PROT|nr:acetyl/propionyl/methylcrotonyl-CoA carboxylase subunit alpha [Parvularcula marina]RFB04486.1 acetyl/propionyl/methylcrotonyl-CoA carboxylase subunit alpha [Parvularcula marina]
MITKLLIANRGEIACRIARTAHRMGVRTVAVFSDADCNAPHVRLCDEAIHLGPAPAAESYLIAEKIIAAAKRTGADAIHPGYGFLSENADFAEAVEDAGIIFVGPTAETIRAMGSKSAAKDLMEEAGVPVTPGYQGEDQSLRTFRDAAERIGYPVLLKATAGGGGKGMRMVENAADLADTLDSARREAKSAFGDERFLIEKYVPHARHLEVQIFGDGKGNVVHMFERDCSVQRRHQKIIEEAPAPDLPPAVRAKLLEAGVNAGKAVNYRGAGTVEFLYDTGGQDGGQVYFMEMNTRLQVEHPVSEMITGLDFVEWQLRIASGDGLPYRQEDIVELGHAFEARLYAEDASQNFAPSIGTLTTLHLPGGRARIDSGVEEGQTITPHYDPMIAKIITHGARRSIALNRLVMALEETRVAGLETNAPFLHRLAQHPKFARGEVSTRFIEHHGSELFDEPAPDAPVWAAAALFLRHVPDAPAAPAFRLNRAAHEVLWLEHDGEPALFHLYQEEDGYRAVLEPDASAAARREGREAKPAQSFTFTGSRAANGEISLTVNGRRLTAKAARHGKGVRIWLGAEQFDIRLVDPLTGAQSEGSAEGSLTAPMPGIVTLLNAKPGDEIAAGASLLVMEAMKMEHSIKAPAAGVLKAYRFSPGDQVKEGDLLVEFEAAE